MSENALSRRSIVLSFAGLSRIHDVSYIFILYQQLYFPAFNFNKNIFLQLRIRDIQNHSEIQVAPLSIKILSNCLLTHEYT